MAKAIIDHLEAVKVQEKHGEEMVFAAFRVFDQTSEAVNEQKPIRQARQRIGYFSLGDIGLGSRHAQCFSRGIVNGKSPAEHPPKAPVLVEQAMLAFKVRR